MWMYDHKKDIIIRLTVNYKKGLSSTYDCSSSDEKSGMKKGKKYWH